MAEEKRKVKCEVRRELTYIFESELTKKEYESMRENLEIEEGSDGWAYDVHAADVASFMNKDISSEEPARFDDQIEELTSEWDKPKKGKNKKL